MLKHTVIFQTRVFVQLCVNSLCLILSCFNKTTCTKKKRWCEEGLTADIWVLQVQPVLLGLQKHLEVYSSCLRLIIDESSWDASGKVRFITAKAQVQQKLLWVVIPQVEYVHHSAGGRGARGAFTTGIP